MLQQAAGQRTVPQPLRPCHKFEHRLEDPWLSLQGEEHSRQPVGMLRTLLENQLRHVHPCRTDCSAGLAIHAGFDHSL